jgi:hypothetical protein
MSVVSFRRNAVPAVGRPRGGGGLLEWLGFLLGAVLTLVLPVALYCAVVGRLWPLWLMMCEETLSAVLGLLLFRRPHGGLVSCVPKTGTPTSARPRRLKLAA